MTNVKAHVLITAEAKKVKNAAEKLRASNVVQNADIVTGPYDIIATLEAEDVNALGKLITREILSLDGIERTITCIVVSVDE